MRSARKPIFARSLATLLVVLLASCGGGGGGGGGTPSAPEPTTTTATPGSTPGTTNSGGVITGPAIAGGNVIPMVVDQGAKGTSINVPYVTVTVCVPGTSTCVDVDHVLVDTGSTGLRLTQAALASLALPGTTTVTGAPVGECAQFASGFAWGAVRRADVRLGGQTAPSVSIQAIDDPAFPVPPTSCTHTGGNIAGGGDAKGILGVGLFVQDCGTACQVSTTPGVYFDCSNASNCTSTLMDLTRQVTNPVAVLPSDNNGVVLVLPPVPLGGATRVAGSLILGIGTQPNNQLGSATVLTTDSRGFIGTTYKGTTYNRSFIDSGSNGYFFTDAALPKCSVSTDFYCPPAPTSLTAVQTGLNGTSQSVTFPLEGVDPLPATTTAAQIGGDPGAALNQSFDWGLPFFFGRTVFTAISGRATPGGTGPYFAW